MQSPDNLQVTEQARVLAILVYGATSRFPPAERFGLTGQMRRATVSIGSNIAEGCGRLGDRELARFLHIALGSASELEFQARVATDLGLLTSDAGAPLVEQLGRVKRMLARLIKALRSRSSVGWSDGRTVGR